MVQVLADSTQSVDLNLGLFFDGVIPSGAVFQAERGISRGAPRHPAQDPSARW